MRSWTSGACRAISRGEIDGGVRTVFADDLEPAPRHARRDVGGERVDQHANVPPRENRSDEQHEWFAHRRVLPVLAQASAASPAG